MTEKCNTSSDLQQIDAEASSEGADLAEPQNGAADNKVKEKEEVTNGAMKAQAMDTTKPAEEAEADTEAPAAKRAKPSTSTDTLDSKYIIDSELPTVSHKADGTGKSLAKLDVNLRKFQRIPVFIVDYHNDVLEFLYRSLGSRHLPLENNILVHFDSHPDMVISRELPARASYNKDTMLAELSIENWIMPICYAGHVNRVVWLKNSWCQQMPIGSYDFKVGEKNDLITVDLPLDYFIAEGNYSDTEEMHFKRDMKLHVYDADGVDAVDPNDFLSASDATNFILDIDLDFFSTANPFLDIYKKANCYDYLREIFYFESAAKCTNYRQITERRLRQLEALKTIFTHLEENRTFDELLMPPEDVIGTHVIAKIHELYGVIKQAYKDEEIDWLLIYDSGSTADCNGLPNHISTEAELESYFERFRTFLHRLPVPPVAITVACSAEDDYCPQSQVNYIQDKVLSLLAEAFGDLLHDKPILHFMDDEWDIMRL